MKIKQASILDYSYPFLDPAVWDQDQNLYAYQKDFILRMVNKMCETYGLVNSNTWIEDIVIIGSLTTSKWLLTSDLDVHIRVNLEAFKANVLPQATVEQAFEELDTVRKMFDRAKILTPMTQHPIEFYFESISFRPSNTALVGVYSVLQNKWVKEPIMFDADLDFEESKKDVIAQAEALAEELDSSLGKIQRDIQRVDELEAVINAWDSSKQQLFYAKVEQKLKAIEAEILKDIKVKQDLVDARHADQNATSEIEIKFKWLARFGFFGILSNLKTLMEQTGGKVTTQELPLIDKIISEGSIKLARLRDKYLIDPNGKVIPMGGMDHGLWIMRNRDLLEKQYGIRDRNTDWFKVMQKMIAQGWVRITLSDEAKGGQFGVDIQDFRNIPSSVDNFIAEHFNPKEGPIYFANAADEWVPVSDPFPSAQKAVNKALQQKRMGTIKEAGSVLDANGVKVFQNPTYEKMVSLLDSSDFHSLRGLVDPSTSDIYVWDAYKATHGYVTHALGMDFNIYDPEIYTNYRWQGDDEASINNLYEMQQNSKQKRMGSINIEADNVINFNGAKIYKNPTWEQAENLYEASNKSHPGLRNNKHLRYVISPQTNELFIWDAYNAHHTEVMEALGIPTEAYDEYAGDIVEFEDLDRVFSQYEENRKKQSTGSLKEAFLKQAFEEPNEADVLLVDFDSTIAVENRDGSIGDPMPNAKESLDSLKNAGYNIEIYSVRANDEKGLDEVKEWLDKNNIAYDSIFQGEKPRGTIIDDHAIRFNNNWDEIVKQVEKSEKKASIHISAVDSYYHGGSGSSIRQIAKDGYVMAPLETGSRNQSPLAGRAYLTKDLGYALIYALGADMVGYQGEDANYGNGESEGGIVLVAPNEDSLIPDEDWLGEQLTTGFESIWNKQTPNTIYTNLAALPILRPVFDNLKRQNKNRLWEMSYQSMIGKMAIRILQKSYPEYLKRLAKESHSLSHEGNMKVLQAWVFDKVRDNPKLKKDGSNFFDIAQEIPVTKTASLRQAAIALQTIDPKTFKRKEPYALFIGTGDYGKAGKIDMFNVYGEHPMITESNALPTVTLDTLVQQNIPIIGKEPRAGGKQPFQDISGLYKQAQTKKVKQGSYSCLMALLPHEIAQEIVEFGVRTVPDDKLYLDEDGKLGRELESHITIKYGLLTNDAKHVRRSFNHDKPFKATLGKVRHFQPPELPFDVLTVEIISDDLVKANKKVCDNFDCAKGLVSDEYKPHITIAYMKRDTAEEYIGSDEFEGKEIELDTVIFSPHKGNRTYFSISQDKESSFVLEQINKIASGNNFLPSFFNDTNNEWQFEHGGDDQEIDLNPDSVSDETTWYAPCTEGKPRTKEVWRQFISMFTTPFSKKEDVQIEAVYDKELEEAEKNALGEDQTLLEYSKGFYDPKDHDFPHNTTWDSLTQDGEPSKPTSVTYSPQISNEDNLDQNSPGGYPRRFMGKPKGEWFSNEGEVNNALIDMLKNREAALEITADLSNAYWIDPDGNQFQVRGSNFGNSYGRHDTHDGWIQDNLEMLKKDYGIEPRKDQWGSHLDSRDLINYGWIRIGDSHGKGWGVSVKDLSNIPSSVDNLLAQFATEGAKIEIDDSHNNYETIEWPVKSIQQAVNKARTIHATIDGMTKVAGNADGGWISPSGKYIPTSDHFGYVASHLHDFGLSQLEESTQTKFELDSAVVRAMQYIFDQGWLRVRVWGDAILIQGNNINNVKSHAEDFIYDNLESAKRIRIETDNEQAYTCTTDEFKAEGWDAFLKQPIMAKQATLDFDKEYPVAGGSVDGRTVIDGVPNQSSIGASLTDYDILPGIREVSFSSFTQMPNLSYYSMDEEKRTKQLAEQIQQSNEITPLIVAVDNQGPYILEGGHRFDALRELGANSFPAMVVLDNESLDRMAKQAGSYSSTYTDEQGEEMYNEQHMNDTDCEPYVNHDQRDYSWGFHDSPENTGYNIGWPKDNQPSVVHLDTLENPAYRLDPFGIGSYNVIWYTSLPFSDGIEQGNPD